MRPLRALSGVVPTYTEQNIGGIAGIACAAVCALRRCITYACAPAHTRPDTPATIFISGFRRCTVVGSARAGGNRYQKGNCLLVNFERILLTSRTDTWPNKRATQNILNNPNLHCYFCD